jgi:nitroreductase
MPQEGKTSMTPIMDSIKGRRSIRRYQDTVVPKQFLQKVLESIQWSPSWANTQCWEIVVVEDPGQKQKLQNTLSETNPAKKSVTEAPLVIALCGKRHHAGYHRNKPTTKFGDWFMFDLGIAAQSLCLTAHSLGLGTVIIGMLDHDKAKEILGVEDAYELVALIPMGYPAKDARAPKRREISEFTHFERFSKRRNP